MHVKYRSLLSIVILTIVTFGIYTLYWTVKTKNEIKSLGAKIPSAFYMFIPFANFYFWYMYAEGFCKFVKKDESNLLLYFLFAIMPIILLSVIWDIESIVVGTLKFIMPNIDLLSISSWRLLLNSIVPNWGIQFISIMVFQVELNKLALKEH